MKLLLSISILLFAGLLKAQPTVRVIGEAKNKGYVLYAINSSCCPVTISLELILSNLSFSQGQQKVFNIPATNDKVKLGELDAINPNGKYTYTCNHKSVYGYTNSKYYDSTYAYELPYRKGKEFLVSQGYNGIFTHQQMNAIDFDMPIGTEILAARDGIVIKVVQNYAASCPEKECEKFSNYIIVFHADGTRATYAHIKTNGSRVRVGDKVKQGDLIAFSGNVGRTTGPHLHFACSLENFDTTVTVRTLFKIEDGSKSDYLKEKITYLKGY